MQNPVESNSCVVYWVYTGEATDPVARAQLSLLAQIASEPAFNVLRTKEQLGYVVNLASTSTGIRILVQSEKPPAYIEARIEAFLSGFKETLASLSADEYERHRQSLIAKKEEQPKNLGMESRRFWRHIMDKYYEFGKRETDVAQLRRTSHADVMALFDRAVDPSSPERRKLSTHLKSQHRPAAKFDPALLPELVERFGAAGISPDDDAVRALVESRPDLEAVRAFGLQLVERSDAADDDKAALRSFLAEMKGLAAEPTAEPEASVRPSNTFIKDIHEFKASLTPSQAAVPLEPLVVSRM